MHWYQLYQNDPFLIGGVFLLFAAVTVLVELSGAFKLKIGLIKRVVAATVCFIGSFALSDLFIGFFLFQKGDYINPGALRGGFYILISIFVSIFVMSIFVRSVIYKQMTKK